MGRGPQRLRVVTLLLAGALLAGLLWWGQSGGLSLQRRDTTWAHMVESGLFRVGMDPSFPPFEQLDDAGRPVGYDVDLAQALADRWGLRLELHAMGFDSLVDAAMATRVDAVISAMPWDERLTRDLAISPAYFEAGLRLATPSGSSLADAKIPADLAGARVAVEWGSAGDMVARRWLNQAAATAPADAAPPFVIVQAETADDAMAAVLRGDADAVLVDAVSLRQAQGAGSPLTAVGPVFDSNPYVILSPRRAGRLAAEIESALAAFAADDTLNALEKRWFGALPALPALPDKPALPVLLEPAAPTP